MEDFDNNKEALTGIFEVGAGPPFEKSYCVLIDPIANYSASRDEPKISLRW
jgi:hypothetical protein